MYLLSAAILQIRCTQNRFLDTVPECPSLPAFWNEFPEDHPTMALGPSSKVVVYTDPPGLLDISNQGELKVSSRPEPEPQARCLGV